jgi:hypothetical protein
LSRRRALVEKTSFESGLNGTKQQAIAHGLPPPVHGRQSLVESFESTAEHEKLRLRRKSTGRADLGGERFSCGG